MNENFGTSRESVLARNLDFIGGLYCQKYVAGPGGWAQQDLEGNWWEALKFFFDHSFMQNRGVDTSWRLRNLTVSTLERHLLATRDTEQAYVLLQQVARDNRLDSLLPPKHVEAPDGYRSSAQLNNDRDRQMVRDILSYVSRSEEERNIYEAIVSRVRRTADHRANLEDACSFLRGFYGVGDKIAPFIIQDVALLNREANLVPPNLPADAYRFAFPIDTLIRQIASRFACALAARADDNRIRDYFIGMSLQIGVYPPLCAAALWHLAYHSTEILIEHCIKITALT